MIRTLLTCLLLSFASLATAQDAKPIRVGIIGLDTSHCIAFTKILNDPKSPKELSGCRVVAEQALKNGKLSSFSRRSRTFSPDPAELIADMCRHAGLDSTGADGDQG